MLEIFRFDGVDKPSQVNYVFYLDKDAYRRYARIPPTKTVTEYLMSFAPNRFQEIPAECGVVAILSGTPNTIYLAYLSPAYSSSADARRAANGSSADGSESAPAAPAAPAETSRNFREMELPELAALFRANIHRITNDKHLDLVRNVCYDIERGWAVTPAQEQAFRRNTRYLE